MSPETLSILTFFYGTVGLVVGIGFAPQVYNLIVSTGRSESISISTWGLWVYTATVSTLYAVFVVGNLPLIIVESLNWVGAVSVLMLTVYNRHFRFGSSLPRGISTTTAKKLKLKL